MLRKTLQSLQSSVIKMYAVFPQISHSEVTLLLLFCCCCCRYGDRIPRGIHSKLFGIVWIACGLVIIALLMSFITTSLTMDIIKSDIPVYGSKVSLDDSSNLQYLISLLQLERGLVRGGGGGILFIVGRPTQKG